MNSHPFGYESGYNYVAGRGSYNRNMHQGQSNQRWMEPRGSDQPFRQQHPPRYHGQRPFYNAYQGNGHGGQPRSYQQAPPLLIGHPLNITSNHHTHKLLFTIHHHMILIYPDSNPITPKHHHFPMYQVQIQHPENQRFASRKQ